MGAVYALERLARDSPRDQPTIDEVLATFVRTSAPHRHLSTLLSGYTSEPCPDQRPSPDVQAALTVLARRDVNHDNGATLDLSDTCLRKVHLPKAQFDRVDLRNSDLTRADLSGAHIVEAILINTRLDETDLRGAKLIHSRIMRAGLDNAWTDIRVRARCYEYPGVPDPSPAQLLERVVSKFCMEDQ
ncbi:pentapeptide repeat-containing protein [Kutzneria viridogrisea]